MELADIVKACDLDWTWPPWFVHYMTGEPMTAIWTYYTRGYEGD